ncbi:hypothetical protein Poli38472_010577 [Pythium oligandrum]|uniref:Uncharacterized protein n=1 Tax=Pythium oligandrum TaxID=41045 RepID=A0A8K1F9X9_PYTOL|nr:hypothetical protein Poli38472_010577 [Pythium oligandrum]|eukprot:TMW55695.1 hypothetical protein Poli38472_010577 [Pythium oligandrum]
MDHTEASGLAYEGSMDPHGSSRRADVTILSIDPDLADLHAADAEESEAVALAVLEWLFIETNACYKQHYYSQKSISFAASFLNECLFDGLTGAILAPETEVEAQIFQSETSPVPEPRDRHAVQSLPLRSLEKSACGVDQCSTTSSIQRNGARNRLTTITTTKRRRNPDRGTIAVISKTASVVSLPKVIVVDEKEPDEKPDVKAWRQRCEESLRGPERKDNPQTMSRKRFELHQRLATDYLLQESLYSKSPRGNPAPGSTSPSSHKQQSPRPYKQVPPDPIPPPSLSPIGKGALVVPKTHLVQSYSTPSLRIRSSGALRRDNPHTMTTGKLQTLASLDATRNSRPNTALGVIPGKRSKEALLQYGGHAHKSSSTEYLREFPQPHHGVIKIMKSRERSASNTSVDAAIESARQRLAWIS